jgi:prepilin-type N-terminal cleavage/methylation domain-containing protein
MKLRNIKRAFTLIELLVVITIMWILATSSVGIYTTQIKKARDSTRTTDIEAINTAVMQFYQDKSEYPSTGEHWLWSGSSVAEYIQWLIPEDPKHDETCLESRCAYVYIVGVDKYGIQKGAYELSIAFENQWNVDSRAVNDFDGWNDAARRETWINISTLNTSLPQWTTVWSASIESTSAASIVDEKIIISRWKIGKVSSSSSS